MCININQKELFSTSVKVQRFKKTTCPSIVLIWSVRSVQIQRFANVSDSVTLH